ncbi:EipB family protein [Magnetospira sp. QH-2]|uniref:EipB family protein n=1 Tax=Magnetospira sp. (strain QH-2) TaxID=1288970 RepID=UPI0003E81323|nr:DUF1849 family protein [Magnetospira sp. QH-2]CCQ74156.1 Conserved exported protein of unknown function [Magnetospira sp. QH-2]
MMFLLRGLFGILLIVLVWGDATARAQGLVSHRALYDVSLLESREGSGVVQATGIFFYRFQSRCDGWSTENRSRLILGDADGGLEENLWSLTSWEARDGTHYRFWGREVDNGAVISLMRGEATLEADNRQVVFTQPEEAYFDLPPGTLFPSRHLIELLKAARDGKRMMAVPLFDGADQGGAMQVSAMISGSKPSDKGAGSLLEGAGLTPLPVTPIHMAYFDPASGEPLPVVELSAHYRPDGIAESLVQDFGDFAIRGVLMQLELLPDEGC